MSYDAKAGHGYQYGGPAFPGGILVGIGLGIMLGDFFAWLLIGIVLQGTNRKWACHTRSPARRRATKCD